MTSNTGSARVRRHAPLARLLAFVLLAFVAYTTTAESVHRHGGLALKLSESSLPSVGSSGGANPSANDAPAPGACLICQLRHNLSFGLLHSPPQTPVPQVQRAPLSAAPVSFDTQANAPGQGRAPPALQF